MLQKEGALHPWPSWLLRSRREERKAEETGSCVNSAAVPAASTLQPWQMPAGTWGFVLAVAAGTRGRGHHGWRRESLGRL